MSVRLRGVSGGSGSTAQGGAESRLASLVSEALRRSSGQGFYWAKEDEGLGVQVSADAERVHGSYVYRWVKVSFLDSYVDENGVFAKRIVAEVGVTAARHGYHVEFSSARLPSTWRPSQNLALLPAALNAALSALRVRKVLGEEFGVAVGAGGVSVKRMFDAHDAKRRPAILMSVSMGGSTYTFNDLHAHLFYALGTSGRETKHLHLDGGVLLRHGNRKLAKQLYVLSWLRKELEGALKRFCEEKGCKVEVGRLYRVELNGMTTHFMNPDVSDLVRYFDEEYLVLVRKDTRLMLDERERNLPQTLENMFKHGLLQVEGVSEFVLKTLIMNADALLRSGDPRERELGILLALLIKKAYEEAERTIPG